MRLTPTSHLIIGGRGQHAYVSLKERGLGFDD
jgi:hypothetical protein